MNTRDDLKLLISDCKLTTLPLARLEHIFKIGFYSRHLKRDQLITDNQRLNINDKSVNKLQLFFSIQAWHSHINEAYLLIRYDDATEELLQLKGSKFKKLNDAFIFHGAATSGIFARVTGSALPWHEKDQISLYASQPNNNVYAYYDTLHEFIIKRIHVIVGNIPDKPVNVIDAGCGDGRLVKKLLACNLQKLQVSGFDFNENNINKAVATCGNYFAVGDLLKTDHVISELTRLRLIAPLSEEVTTVLVLSGSLTRMVLKNLYEGLEALTSIYNCKHIDYLIGGGIGDPFINRYIAKQFGFDCSYYDVNEDYFICQRMSREKFILYKIQKLQRKKILDLTFCPDDSIIEELLPYASADTVVDLSFCVYTPRVEQAIALLLANFPRISIIFRARNSSEKMTSFTERFLGKALITSLRQLYTTDEAELFGPLRRKPRQTTRLFDSACLATSSLPVATSGDRPSLAHCLLVYSGDTRVANTNIFRHFFMQYLALLLPGVNVQEFSQQGLDNFLNIVKAELLSSQSQMLKLVYGDEYALFLNNMKITYQGNYTIHANKCLSGAGSVFLKMMCEIVAKQIKICQAEVLQKKDLQAISTLILLHMIQIQICIVEGKNLHESSYSDYYCAAILKMNSDSVNHSLQNLLACLNQYFPSDTDPHFIHCLAQSLLRYREKDIIQSPQYSEMSKLVLKRAASEARDDTPSLGVTLMKQ